MNKSSFLYICAFSLVSLFSFGNAYDIKITLKGAKFDKVILAHYYGSSFQIVDTAELVNETVVFTGKEPLKPGVYAIAALNKSKIFDFLVDCDFCFEIETQVNSFIDSAKVYQSVENSDFFKFLKYNSKLYFLKKEIQKNKDKPKVLGTLEKIVSELNQEISSFKKNILIGKPKSLFALILKAMQPSPTLPKSEPKLKRYQYYKNHFWDNINLNDVRTLRSPIFQSKFETFFDKVLMQQADTLIQDIDQFLDNHKFNDEVKKYLAWNLLVKYEYPKIMGLDKVFVHLVENYYKKGLIPNISKSVLDYLIERSNTLKSLLIGSEIPDITLMDTTGAYIHLHHLIKKKYSIIFFWDFDCKICQKEVRDLNKLFDKRKQDLDIIAVCTVNELLEWKESVKSSNKKWIHINGTRSADGDYHDLFDIHTTPTIYLVDENKKIIAKRLAASQLNAFLKNYEKLRVRN